MIASAIQEILYTKNYTKIETNLSIINLYYKVENGDTLFIALLEHEDGAFYSKEQYDHVMKKTRNHLLSSNIYNPQLLSIICADHIEDVRDLANEIEHQWFIDSNDGKLIIYENQDSLFMELKKEIEDLVYSESLNDQIEKRSSHNRLLKKGQKKISICNTTIIAINIIIFVMIEIVDSTQNTDFMIRYGAMYWPYVVNNGEYYRLFTYMFLHFGISHLINNMIILGFIGDNLEREIGKVKYILIYLITGITAGILSMIYNMMLGTRVVSVGASGAIFGVVGAMLYILIINKGKLEDLRISQILLFSLLSLYSGLTSQGIDNIAHIAGFIVGLFLAIVLYKKQKKR